MRTERDCLKRLAGIEGVVQLAGESAGADALTLRDCGGTSLATVLQTGRCDTHRILSLACQLARTMAEIHRAGVIHRDINPTNILVSAAHEVVVIDFDLAVLATQHMAVKPDGQIVGTLLYMAPEQTGRTGRAVDQRADMYALGATLYELAAGRTPFERGDTLQLIHDHLVREPVPPWQVDERVPRGLSNIIVRLLAKAPEQRYQSAEGLLHDLQRVRGELEHGGDGVFDLGERDFGARLAPPAYLVGRDAERTLLLGAFADAMHTPRRTVLVEGPAGVGKSSLVNELRPVVAKAGGWFVYGKFDQYQRDGSTEGALIQALRALGRVLLTQSAGVVAAERQRILHSLGRRAGLITQASPEFALLLGDQEHVPEVDPRQAELQIQQAVLDLLGVVASPERPLVVVVDDLQWAGELSLRVFERMMVAPELRGLLLVGSLRSDEVNAGHVLAPMLARWQQLAQPPSRIAVANLTLASLSEMTGHMLRLAPEPSLELAQALNVLTGGNPFDTVEMINALRGDGVLSLVESGWQWDEIKVRHFIGRGNVVDLLAARISRLPPASRELLEFMSCLGSEVECKLLCTAVGLGDEDLQARLRLPLEDGLLVADRSSGQDSVRFRHDRVQQAMLGTMDQLQRGHHHLQMARRLAIDPALMSEAAQQYLACIDMLDDAQEQRRAAHLFHRLGQRLLKTATFELAERYLASADQLLIDLGEPRDAALRHAIDVARHAALYSLGRVDESDPLYARIEMRTHDPLDLVEPASLQIRSLDMRGHMHEAIALGVRLLGQLGLHVPPDFSDPDREKRLDALPEWVRQESHLDHSKRAQTQDPRLLGIYKLLPRLYGSAYQSHDLKVLAWVTLEAQRHWVEHGPSENLMGCVGNLGTLLVERRWDYRTGYEISRHVIAVGEALGFEVRTAAARFAFSWRAAWFEPLESALDHATRAADDFRVKGDDASFACYFSLPKCELLLEIAPALEVYEAELETALVQCRRTGNITAAVHYASGQQFLRTLRGQARARDSFGPGQFSEQALMARMGERPDLLRVTGYYRAFQALIWGDVAELTRYASAPFFDGVNCDLFRSAYSRLFVALARAWQIQQGAASTAESAPLILELEECRSWFKGRAADQPYNFLHLLRLVEAEQAWALGDLWKAAAIFDSAVVEAEARQRPWHRALITERAGLFNLAHGLTGAGRNLLARARDHYQAWGAKAKVDDMEREHAFLRVPARSLTSQLDSTGRTIMSSAVSPDVLDLVGVLRASQALSSETSLVRLTARVSEVLATLSGATKVLVLSCNEGQWSLLSPGTTEPTIPVAQAAERGLVPLSAFAYAQRTGDALVVDDVAADDRFGRDPYFASVPVCSLLLVPINSQGPARAMLLLENRLGCAAFNAQRLDAVMLIAGQLAVSLANAQLYESLEQRVQARTRELQETQAQLVTTARRAGMAEIANNVLHNVGNVLNSVNTSARLVGGRMHRSKTQGLAKAVALMNEHAGNLGEFMTRDPRGKHLPLYLNKLVDALAQEREEVIGELGTLIRSVDHINDIVATQQSHSGASTVVDMAGVTEVVEEALHMVANALERHHVKVTRQLEEVGPLLLDKQRLVQILVNLIVNATQAMQSVPENSRHLTLATALVKGGGGERLRITVQDQGEGIAPENLTRIFGHGFTTRKNGHGFGLHSCAVAATEMGGSLTVHSAGPGCGAVFTIDLPLRVKSGE
jgi:signal transduction histidine kinase